MHRVSTLNLKRTRRNEWTAIQDAILKQEYPKGTALHRIIHMAHHCRGSVYARASQLGLNRPPRSPWTQELDSILITEWKKGMPLPRLAFILHKSCYSVKGRVYTLGLRRSSYYWTHKQDNILREKWPNGTPTCDLSKMLHRSNESIQVRVQKLMVRRPVPMIWTNDKIEHLKKLHRTGWQIVSIANRFKVSYNVIWNEINRLGLR